MLLPFDKQASPIVMKTVLVSAMPILLALFACGAPADAQSISQAVADTGLEGLILVRPIEGGPTRQGVPDFKPLSNTDFVVEQGDDVAASFETDAEGRFRFLIGPGRYTISKKKKGGVGFFGPFEVDNYPGQDEKRAVDLRHRDTMRITKQDALFR